MPDLLTALRQQKIRSLQAIWTLSFITGLKVSEIGSKTKDGVPFKLSEFIKFGHVDGDQDYTRDQAVDAVDATAIALQDTYNSDILPLLPKNDTNTDNEDIVTMVVYMPTTVENEANHGKGEAVPTINLGLKLLAT